MESRRPAVELTNVTKRFGDADAVNDLTLSIGDGEFFSLLGPSGCGKTTTLRMIAGFEYPTSGSLKIDGTEMGLLPANERPVNTVFQSYALFPHMTVEDNIAFGLQMRKVPSAEITQRVGRVLDQVQLSHRATAKPSQLSGGQRQRVALARALVNEPQVLLLDEPLGALDLKLRQTMQVELKDLQARVGITFVYVTHDQEEALTMSDRIGVMDNGRLLQVGEPEDIYEHPTSRFVAGFIGDINLVDAKVAGAGTVHLSNGQVLSISTTQTAGAAVTLALRPERLELYDPDEVIPDNHYRLPGKVTRKLYYGDAFYYDVEVGLESPLEVKEENRPGVETYDLGDDTVVVWDPASTNVVQD